MSHCWILSRADGLRVGLTDADIPIMIDNVICHPCALPNNIMYDRYTDNATGSSEVWGIFHHDALTQNDLYANRWAGAQVQMYIDAVLTWQGVIGKIEWNGQQFKLHLEGMMHTLQRAMLRSYLTTCDATLGDARCGVNIAQPQYSVQGVIGAVVHRTAFAAEVLVNTALPLRHGMVLWGSGGNAGLKSIIREVSAGDGVLSLQVPPPFVMTVGDSFTATIGCDKTLTTCRDVFSNVPNFRGCPYMPGIGALLQVPSSGDNNDGGV